MVDHDITESPRAHALVEQVMDAEIREFDYRRHDIHATSLGLVPLLVAKARLAAQNYGDSWRGFLVGAAAIAYDISPDHPRYGIYAGGNFRARHGEDYDTDHDAPDMPKLCAEMDIMMRADNDDMQRIGMFVVAATANHQRILNVTKVRSDTLHPCQDCEDVMKGSPLVDKDTLIVTVGAGKDIFQVQSYKEFRDRYKKVRRGLKFEDADTYHYSHDEWADREAHYRQLVKKNRAGGSVYSPDVRREVKRRRLALAAITAA